MKLMGEEQNSPSTGYLAGRNPGRPGVPTPSGLRGV